MVYPRMRAWVAGILFVLWLGFLATLAYENHNRVIVAGPQLERSNLIVVAELADSLGRPAAAIKIKKVLYAEKIEWRQLAGQGLELAELAFFSNQQLWNGPGDYVVPLTRREFEMKSFDRVTPLPLSPAYYPATTEVMIEVGKHPEPMARRVAELTGTPAGRLKELFNAPNVMLFNVPFRGDDNLKQFAKMIDQAGGKELESRLAESRIYPATADVLRQVQAISR